MMRERTNAGGDDDESEQEENAADPNNFQPEAAFKDCMKTLKTPPIGGGGREHKQFLIE